MVRYLLLSSMVLLMSCAQHKPMKTVDHVDIDRFMGDWYVIANIPTFLEVGAHNAIESYALNQDGTVATTFTFRDGGFDGDIKKFHPTGYIQDTDSNATWGMQFLWPFKADYRIVYLDESYETTVIAREARDYIWLMSRKPKIDDSTFERISKFIASIGYDVSKLQRVPQRWNNFEKDNEEDTI